MLERVFGASALTVAVQDGPAAGQTVPHVHAHVIPRRAGDLDSKGGNDAIYGMLQDGGVGYDSGSGSGEIGQGQHEKQEQRTHHGMNVRPDSEREPRSEVEMRAEAEWFARELELEELQ